MKKRLLLRLQTSCGVNYMGHQGSENSDVEYRHNDEGAMIRQMITLLRLLIAAWLSLLVGCSEQNKNTLQGYAEGEYIYVAAALTGKLETLHIERGQEIAAGALLFTLEQQNERAVKVEAEQRSGSAQARLANLKTGRRLPELDVIRAQLAQASAAERLSSANVERQEKLLSQGFISKEKVDEARTMNTRDRARLNELQAQLTIAGLAARDEEIKSAAAEVAAAEAVVAQAAWRLAQKSITAPAAGLVHDTLYVQGEWVTAGSPVVSLLPKENIKLRFFVPEPLLSRLVLQQDLKVYCDGCEGMLIAKISYIARQAEYTPPVLYSKEHRAKLVYLCEARLAPKDAVKLKPGQPVDVILP